MSLQVTGGVKLNSGSEMIEKMGETVEFGGAERRSQQDSGAVQRCGAAGRRYGAS